ncbi:MAG: HAD-IIB family hydrolase [Candidatus Altiarchaeota archaeon]|nr:HAD-IIB family hydrolase [Candidatus Altiarchaeota archaeon]
MDNELIVYSDLDGTLLDEGYSFCDALPALKELKEKSIPLIFCTSKTRAEIEYFREELGIEAPFISENGGAIFIPEGFFNELEYDKVIDGYRVIELGTGYKEIRHVLSEVRKMVECGIRGFGDLGVEELVKVSGLDRRSAELSMMREYDEPFMMKCSQENEKRFISLVEERGLGYTRGGLFHHLMGDNDKGRAVNILTETFRRNGFGGLAVGLGDSCNDFPMLVNVDVPVLVRKPGGGFADFSREGLVKTEGIGPMGWNQAVLDILDDLY